MQCTVCTSSCRLSKRSNSYYRISRTFCSGNFDRATLFGTIFTNNNIEITPFKVGTHDGTSPCNKSQGLVASCELATSPTNSNWFEFVGLVAGTKFWELEHARA